MKSFAMFVVVAAIAVYGVIAVADEVKSGLEPGEFPPAFNVLDCTGPAEGTSLCYRCRYGNRPVVSIFARTLDANVTELIKRVDSTVAKNKDKNLQAFVVLLTDDPEAAEPKLKNLAETNGIKNVPLTVFDGSVGPPDYKISKEADLTVLMWVKSNVKVNRAFEKGELGKSQIARILDETKKILE